ncbi:POC1 centriolar protein homolog A [Geodia barretti]|uniref:POC1 centriolar protein homolog A n=1 Tax=Geodia barretti TaxID=519541 RepID=A0AA35WNB0_GEOBA|nr:POC1 centriolar protein homolog A [Geodia barretti]
MGVDFSPSGEFFSSVGADEQVLVWRTNFDSLDHGEILRAQRKRPAPSSHRHHSHDLPPPHTLTQPTHQLDARRTPCDTVSAPSTVTNVGPRLFHRPHPSHPPPQHLSQEEDDEGAGPVPKPHPLKPRQCLRNCQTLYNTSWASWIFSLRLCRFWKRG